MLEKGIDGGFPKSCVVGEAVGAPSGAIPVDDLLKGASKNHGYLMSMIVAAHGVGVIMVHLLRCYCGDGVLPLSCSETAALDFPWCRCYGSIDSGRVWGAPAECGVSTCGLVAQP